jgi:uncharacterized protein (DUF934 family)
MPKLIKDRAIIDDAYTLAVPDDEGRLALPDGPVLVKLACWRAFRDALLAHPHPVGVQLASDEFAEEIAADLDRLALVAIEFPAFADGRGYSTAFLLRTRHGFRGELRAVGDVFKDTLFYQQRCGFNAFAVRDDKDIDDALAGLDTFSQPYQGSVSEPAPLYHRRHA